MSAGEMVSKREARKNADCKRIAFKEQEKARIREIRGILGKRDSDRSEAEQHLLEEYAPLVSTMEERTAKRQNMLDRLKEVVDEPEQLQAKCAELADAIRRANNLVVYTGAGISTAAQIPDYRGPEGVWTLLQRGQLPSLGDLSDAEPTYTHCALAALQRLGVIKHLVSQNCDGLHVRSGFPRSCLSELHGNMFIEVLRRYRCLWGLDRPPDKRPKLYIVNLQWTPKDELATLKINARCDDVMRDVIYRLNVAVSPYVRECDPLFKLHTPLRRHERDTCSRKILSDPNSALYDEDTEPEVEIEDQNDTYQSKPDIELKLQTENQDQTKLRHDTSALNDSKMLTEEHHSDIVGDISEDKKKDIVILDRDDASTELPQSDSIVEKADVSCTLIPKQEMLVEDDVDTTDDSSNSGQGSTTIAASQLKGWYGKGYGKMIKRKRK